MYTDNMVVKDTDNMVVKAWGRRKGQAGEGQCGKRGDIYNSLCNKDF